MNSEYLWESFEKSGKIDDYLKYKESENKVEIENAVYYKGLSNQGTDSGRER